MRPLCRDYANSIPPVLLWNVPYDSEGSCVGRGQGNDGLMAKVNEAIAAALADGFHGFSSWLKPMSRLPVTPLTLVDGEIVADEK